MDTATQKYVAQAGGSVYRLQAYDTRNFLQRSIDAVSETVRDMLSGQEEIELNVKRKGGGNASLLDFYCV